MGIATQYLTVTPRRRVLSIFVMAVLATLLLASPVWAKRVALVIGNSQYGSSPLANPANDARAVSAKLRQLGFKVTTQLELRRDDIGVVAERFFKTIAPRDHVVFYYAGHGVQMDGSNYLLAVDANIRSTFDTPRNSLDVNWFLKRLEATRAAVKIVFLDACRNNPFAAATRGGQSRGGLAPIGGAPSGTLISFATQPGGIAADGTGPNGLYTEQLLTHLDLPGIPVEQMLKLVAAGTHAKSHGRQRPWIEGSLLGNFEFKMNPTGVRVPRIAASELPRHATSEYEMQAWDLATNSDSLAALRSFLMEYPNSARASLARVKIAVLQERLGEPTRRLGNPESTPASAAFSPPLSAKPGIRYQGANDEFELQFIKRGGRLELDHFSYLKPVNEIGKLAVECPVNMSLAPGRKIDVCCRVFDAQDPIEVHITGRLPNIRINGSAVGLLPVVPFVATTAQTAAPN